MSSGEQHREGNGSSSSTSVQSIRGKTDIAWNHVVEKLIDGKRSISCLYCGKVSTGGGIHRMKQHLAGKKGAITVCRKVPPDVRYQMEESLKEIATKKKESQDSYNMENTYGPPIFEGEDRDDEEDVGEIPRQTWERTGSARSSTQKGKSQAGQSSKVKPSVRIGDYFAPWTTPGSQPSIKSVLAGKEAIARADMEIAKFFYDTCIPINACNSRCFQRMFDAAIAIRSGYKVPNYHALRIPLLRDAKKEVQLWVDSIRNTWAEYGCTIMGDGWSDNRDRTLINFLVYSPRGTVFWKSMDASDIVKYAQALFKLFQEVIEWVGASNVVHMVTDNGANYVAAGKLVEQRYASISWSPCAAHCLNLVMKDIAKMDHVAEIVSKASRVTKFVYNHGFWLAWLRKRKDWTEIIRPGDTRFGTTFTALYNVYHHMHDLKALVTCKEFTDSRLARERKTKEVIAIVHNIKFWNDCLIIVKIMEPLMRLLKIVDGDKKPSIGYIYEGMHRARKGIKSLFKKKKSLYKPYTQVIKSRWDRQLRKDVHAAAYYLNPVFQYDKTSFCEKPEVMNGMLKMLSSKGTGSKTKLVNEMRLFRERLESFGQELAFETCRDTQPDEWWRLFGGSAPNLRKLAIRILGQTSTSSGCERNWSVFERIHTKKRNRLEHQRLNDLVYVHYNLKLKDRWLLKPENFDPVDYESIDKTDFWVVDDEDESFLDYEDIENMLYEELDPPRMERDRRRPREDDADQTDDNEAVEVDDDVDLSSFDRFYIGDDLHDVSVGVGIGGSTSGGGTNEDDEEWLRRGD